MKTRRQLFLEAQETQLREIPIDLLVEIFSRVPATTVATCRFVSKLWRSIIDRPDFTELFLTMSWTRPRLLLFSFQIEGYIFFFSSPQPQNPDENSCLVATCYHVHHIHSPSDYSTGFGSPLGGFICLQERRVSMVICNPVTGVSVSLPKMESKSVNTYAKPFLGYDPIDKQFKVLCTKVDTKHTSYEQHEIMTLENGKYLWRKIQCEPHYPRSNGICIDGILYYTASVNPWMEVSMVVLCFDVRSERFRFINIDGGASWMFSPFTLINYKGKLGAARITVSNLKRQLELWVLEDAMKCKWYKNIYTVPPRLQNFRLTVVGMTGSGEVVLSPLRFSDPFYIYYYNLERNSFTKFRIQGFERCEPTEVYTSLDYAENLKLM
ncbi:unnamed protein product [Microthlaspi erraticum]|uniref:F-box domain-containing protein n=1 Tax=Microthlaspi erraticum TaxID=1685480 RepID=A0A6D2HKN8_9BRAS|nr:unnamed protein product [Microthlaspi erraticum]